MGSGRLWEVCGECRVGSPRVSVGMYRHECVRVCKGTPGSVCMCVNVCQCVHEGVCMCVSVTDKGCVSECKLCADMRAPWAAHTVCVCVCTARVQGRLVYVSVQVRGRYPSIHGGGVCVCVCRGCVCEECDANPRLGSCLTPAPRTCWHGVPREVSEARRGLEVTVRGAAAFRLAAQDSAGSAGRGLVSRASCFPPRSRSLHLVLTHAFA